MSVTATIQQRIRDLGGSTPAATLSLADWLLGVKFPHNLYPKDWDFYGVDTFFNEHRAVYETNPDELLDRIEARYFAEQDFAKHDFEPDFYCGQHFWRPRLFTPFTPGTDDYKEWGASFIEETDLSPVRSVCGEGTLEFVQVIYNVGYPNYYYVCLQDPAQDNPTVFGTDHEVYFVEISVEGSLLECLEEYCTRQDFREIVGKYIRTLT
jgi:hypothetical protein